MQGQIKTEISVYVTFYESINAFSCSLHGILFIFSFSPWYIPYSVSGYSLRCCLALVLTTLNGDGNRITVFASGLEYVLCRQPTPFVFMWHSHYCQPWSASCFMVQVRPVTFSAKARAHGELWEILTLVKPEKYSMVARKMHSGWVTQSLKSIQ